MSILRKLRYITCLPFIIALAAVTAPFTIFFKWKGVLLLYIANKESCSLKEAKMLLKEGKKYKITNNNDMQAPKLSSPDFANPYDVHMSSNTNSIYYKGINSQGRYHGEDST